MNLKEEIKNLIEEPIKDLGYNLEKVEIGQEGGKKLVTVFISKNDGYISIEDCTKVSRVIDPILEEANLIEKSWVLIVSSPGIDG